MPYSRANPSARYKELIDHYRTMHVSGERFLNLPARDTFPGLSLPKQAARIKRLITLTSAQNILDYGCGKGLQYEMRGIPLGAGRVESIQDYWDVDFIHCYDPCYEPFSTLPEGKFDGVISTDVLEHCPESDLAWIVGEIFAHAERFVFTTAACYPAQKRLPNGENAHCTIRGPQWWNELFSEVARSHGQVMWECWVSFEEPTEGGRRRFTETRIGSEQQVSA